VGAHERVRVGCEGAAPPNGSGVVASSSIPLLAEVEIPVRGMSISIFFVPESNEAFRAHTQYKGCARRIGDKKKRSTSQEVGTELEGHATAHRGTRDILTRVSEEPNGSYSRPASGCSVRIVALRGQPEEEDDGPRCLSEWRRSPAVLRSVGFMAEKHEVSA
jgi:hypothetical protein